jgi:Reverse transcriptase (RNA-dependent DNA polymerase)
LKRSTYKNKGIRLPTYAEEFGGTAARGRTGNDTASTSRNAAASTTKPISSIAIAYLSALDEAQGLNTPINEPTSYREAIKSPRADDWKVARDREIKAHEQNNIWELVAWPTGAKVLPGRWVYKVKRGPDGTVTKYKAWWVVKGFQQQYGINYNETYTAMVKAMSYRTVYILSAAKEYKIEQMNFITAFLNGRLDDIVYVE